MDDDAIRAIASLDTAQLDSLLALTGQDISEGQHAGQEDYDVDDYVSEYGDEDDAPAAAG